MSATGILVLCILLSVFFLFIGFMIGVNLKDIVDWIENNLLYDRRGGKK